MSEILARVWENLIGRFSGPMNFRLLLQPAVAGILAVRAGLADARYGRPAFLWAAATNPIARRHLLADGWRDVGRVFIVAIILDFAYQLLVLRGIHVLELLIVATMLSIVPYLMIRGPAARIARRLGRHHRETAPRRTRT